jgi:hypothetical protein
VSPSYDSPAYQKSITHRSSEVCPSIVFDTYNVFRYLYCETNLSRPRPSRRASCRGRTASPRREPRLVSTPPSLQPRTDTVLGIQILAWSHTSSMIHTATGSWEHNPSPGGGPYVVMFRYPSFRRFYRPLTLVLITSQLPDRTHTSKHTHRVIAVIHVSHPSFSHLQSRPLHTSSYPVTFSATILSPD